MVPRSARIVCMVTLAFGSISATSYASPSGPPVSNGTHQEHISPVVPQKPFLRAKTVVTPAERGTGHTVTKSVGPFFRASGYSAQDNKLTNETRVGIKLGKVNVSAVHAHSDDHPTTPAVGPGNDGKVDSHWVRTGTVGINVGRGAAYVSYGKANSLQGRTRRSLGATVGTDDTSLTAHVSTGHDVEPRRHVGNLSARYSHNGKSHIVQLGRASRELSPPGAKEPSGAK